MRVEICACFKDEGPNLLEWIAYHYLMGVDRITLYDDGSSDGWQEYLKTVPSNFIEIRSGIEQGDYSSRQIAIYNHYRLHNNLRSGTDYSIFLDIDEFIWSGSTLQKTLALLPKEASQIRVNWLMFGSSGQKERNHERLVIERFTQIDYGHQRNQICKCFIRAGSNVKSDVHYSFVRGKTLGADLSTECFNHTFFSPPFVSSLFIAHYSIKSEAEFSEKLTRGYNTASGKIPDGYFKENNPSKYYCAKLAELGPLVRKQIESWRYEYARPVE